MQDLFKEIIPSILEQRTPNLESEQDYNPFVVNKALSSHMDVILYANEMNLYPHLDRQMQYDYLFHSARKRKRKFQPWLKKISDKKLDSIKEYFQCSIQKAIETINTLTEQQVDEIVEKVKSKDQK